MDFVYMLIGILLILVLIFRRIIFDYFTNKNDDSNIDSIEKAYIKKKLMSESELIFYNYFKKLEPDYIVLPQINLATIIKKVKTHSEYQNELFRNIDFCIFNKNYEILLAIEINDNTHKKYERRKRDEKVKDILKKSNIDLLTYNVNYPNTEESVIERTKNALQNIKNKNN